MDQNLSNCSTQEDSEYILKLLTILQRTHPFSDKMKTLKLGPDMFERSNSKLSTLIIAYLLIIIDQKLYSALVPVDSTLSAKFNQGVLNFCRQIHKEYPWVEFSGKHALGTTLKKGVGRQFTSFIFQLAKYALRMVCLKQGNLSVPLTVNKGERDENCEILEIKEKKLTYDLLRTLSKKASSNGNLDLMLEKLQKTKEALLKKSVVLIEMFPRQYEVRLQGESTEQRLATAKIILQEDWLVDVERTIIEQDEKLLAVRQTWKGYVSIPAIRRNELVSKSNFAVLQNIASNSKSPLILGADLSLTGFMNSSFSVVEKLIMLLENSSLNEQAKSYGELKDALRTMAEDEKLIAEMISVVESRLEEIERKYDEYEVKYSQSVSKRGGHRFRFPEWDTMPVVKLEEHKYEGNSLISSPANASVAAAIDDARSAFQRVQRAAPIAGTAIRNSPISRKLPNSSVSSLTRSVLQIKKSWTLGSHGDSTVGDIEPLSASSPHGPVCVMPMNPSISEIIDDAEDESRDVFSDSSEWSASRDLPASPEEPPKRRTSIDQCVERFNALKKKLTYSSKHEQ